MTEREGAGVARDHFDTYGSPHGQLNASSSLTRLIGREDEVRECVTRLLEPSVRLLVLTGPGGVGKTRLSIAVAEQLAQYFESGVKFVNLAPVRDPASFVPALARDVGLKEFGTRPIGDLLDEWLQSNEVLLLLDNFEHILPAAVQLAELLAASPGPKALVTSRAPLRISGEFTYLVPPLSLEASGTGADLTDSLRLFDEHARRAQPDFRVTEQNRAILDDICEKLGGLPLAIELAASRLRHLPLQALARMMSQPLSVLVDGRRDQPGRLQTMRNAIAWSYQLLSEHERYLFRHLSVFPDGFRLDAAAWVVHTLDEGAALPSLSRLIDSSLLRLTPERDGTPRYSMLEVIREYGLEQLRAAGEYDTANQLMCEWCEDLVIRAHDTLMRREDDLPWVKRYDRELDTFRHALRWAENKGQYARVLAIAGGIGFYWYSRFLWSEGTLWLSNALSHHPEGSEDLRIEAVGRFWLAVLSHYQGSDDEARPLLDETLEIADLLEDDLLRGGAWLISGVIDEDQGHHDSALEALDVALTHFQRIGNQANEALTLFHMGVNLYGQRRIQEAFEIIVQSRHLANSAGDRWCEGICLTALGRITAERGDLHQSLSLLREARNLRRYFELPALSGEALLLIGQYAAIAARSRRYELAGKLFALESRVRSSVGNPRRYPEKTHFDYYEQQVRDALGTKEFAQVSETAQDLSIQDGLDLILAFDSEAELPRLNEPAARAEPIGQLTSRELEILRLLSEGLTNPGIAEQLFISRGTVRIHVSNILAKLGASTRTEAVRIAQRQGLVSTS